MSTGPLLPGARQGWMNRACPPNQLRDAPCRRRPELFVPFPIRERTPAAVSATRTASRRRENAEIAYRIAKARRVCNGAPGYDEPCPVRMQCLIWAIQAKERTVAGGVAITMQMIRGYHADPEGADLAAEEAGTPEDWAGELAERSRTKQRQPDEGAGGERQRESA